MIDKKFTDEEIIKRLEYMRKNADEGYMAHLENGGEVDKNEEEYIDILCGTLDLINRQKTTIKNLRNVISNQQMEVPAKIEKQIKVEAYKEFADKLKNKWFDERYYSPDVDFDDFIDTLLKEMVGEERMTNEEAVIDIRENIQPIVGGKSLDIAISAIEKQIPKKPTHEATLYKCYTCPNCKNVIDKFEKWEENRVRITYKYCYFCGQALDWSNAE